MLEKQLSDLTNAVIDLTKAIGNSSGNSMGQGAQIASTPDKKPVEKEKKAAATQKKKSNPVPSVTLEDVSKAARELFNLAGQPAVIDILKGNYGVSLIKNLPKDSYGQVVADFKIAKEEHEAGQTLNSADDDDIFGI